MKNNRYPPNWQAIAESKKREANYVCERCGLDCCPSWYGRLVGYSLGDRKRLEMSVHHADYCPENNTAENLKALCSSCHLYYHQRRKGNILTGQLPIPGIVHFRDQSGSK